MRKYALFSSVLLGSLLPSFVFAEAWFIGENPGFDFYSKIDTGTYNIQERLVAQKIKKSSTFAQFWRKCRNIKLIGDNPIDERVLQGIENQNYAWLSALLKWKSITTTEFQDLTTCLAAEYKNVKADIAKEEDARETVAAIGLYADGDRSNSDYDIMYDIERINEIIFSTDIKYKGTKNISSKSLASLLAGNAPAPLLPASSSIIAPPSSSGATTGSSGTTLPTSIEGLLGSSCTNTGMTGPVDGTIDQWFLQELTSVINGSAPSPTTSGFSATNTPVKTTTWTTAPTAANDFYHKMPCQKWSMFCIEVKTIPGGNITLWGGKNVSIEWIVDTFTKHLLPISESSLAYQKMTNNAGSMPIKNLNLWKSIGWLRIYLGNQPQVSRRDKDERTPDQEEAELKAVIDCWYITAWLPTDLARSNSLEAAGFAGRGTDTNTKILDVRPIWVQEAVNTAKLSGCMNEYMREGRQTYYNSLSTDLTEIQAFTMWMLGEIRDLMSILEPMDDLPTK